MESTNLVNSISTNFKLSEAFVEEILAKNQFDQELYSLDYQGFFDTLNPLQRLYLGFSFSTYNRGEEVYNLISPYLGEYEAKRYLDVGCGYGGFLKVFNEHGFDCTGVEINNMLSHYSQLNITGLDNCRVINEDFFNITEAHEPFSVITCNDVIEHVEDPLQAINRMCDMLQPNGVLMMEIPNKDAINFVASDGHFHMFGLTPLNRFEAADYYRQVNNLDSAAKYFELMGEYYPLQYYVNIFKQNNMDVSFVDKHTIGSIDTLPDHLLQLTTSYNHWKKNELSKLTPMMATLVESKFSGYLAELMKDYDEYLNTRNYLEFYRKYFLSFWSIIAVKK
ncbi:class I SAM-dependent methyltransferase [Rufibacter hautae]|uniref:Class I SAM-dependent methyltransferase n=1 Tax=Rufibacter hautae TaxID=2595005 RepID=A0A5B6TMN8_9BACT|nr:class I SAM-dependent methyltransferase [Rufibacter hautae]KAA3437583.1 class I SAM-dependent methyltransferase [Rufibacter hautae]